MKESDGATNGRVNWRSSLRTRTLLTIIVTFLGVYLIAAALLNLIVMRAYEDHETRDTNEKIAQVLTSYSNELADLSDAVTVIAQSSDTYAFMQNNNAAYRDSLRESVLVNNRLSNFMLVSATGQVVYSRGFSLTELHEKPVPDDLLAQIRPGSPLLRSQPDSPLSGIVTLSTGPEMVAAKPIVNDDGKGPARGTVIFTRPLDADEVALIGDRARLVVTSAGPGEANLAPDFRTALSALATDRISTIQRLSEETIAGYYLLRDISGQPALVLKVTAPRIIFAEGAAIMRYFELAGLAVVLISILLLLVLLERMVVRRITGLSRNLGTIGEQVNARVPVSGTDEVSNLAQSINGMLGRLAQSQTNLRRLATFPELSPIAVAEMDLAGDITYVNRELERRFPEIRQSGTNHAFFRDWQQLSADFQNQKADSVTREMNIGDSWIEQRINYVPLALTVRYYALDITERKHGETERQKLYEQEKKLRQDLESEIKKRVEFTRALVHELKTPLTPIMASSDLLLEELKEEPFHSLARNVNDSAQRLNYRIDELLDLARGEVGLMRLKLGPMNAGALIRQVADSVRPAVTGKKQTLTLEIDPQLPLVMADTERIRQVLANLMTNANKFGKPGVAITVMAHTEPNSIVLAVRDNGVALSELEKGRIFEAYRSYQSEKDRLGGLGLGLALSKMLIELHGGTVWVKSEKGVGNTFGFSLPRSPELEASVNEEGIPE